MTADTYQEQLVKLTSAIIKGNPGISIDAAVRQAHKALELITEKVDTIFSA